ncbi:hypothetical protein PcaKH15_36330 [Parageobacillus caldoxylosilyticus]|nr:hypothetical protein PcaKH15_36330 [Parageobacillus caldoxylosilyticus]BDG41519.1 hypothetical protein PcaKH16_36580 [Parageobacillus caldoxylosilyticus]BDG45293.1 hypothetical protein PcaKH35_36380 [Parageobacillus caldoxylosilyticus]
MISLRSQMFFTRRAACHPEGGKVIWQKKASRWSWTMKKSGGEPLNRDGQMFFACRGACHPKGEGYLTPSGCEPSWTMKKSGGEPLGGRSRHVLAQ